VRHAGRAVFHEPRRRGSSRAISYLRHVFRWQESVSRRYLAALKTLAQVRKLQSNTPDRQYNTLINLR
jgi:hypothetical protein